jgi:hypothetical protein
MRRSAVASTCEHEWRSSSSGDIGMGGKREGKEDVEEVLSAKTRRRAKVREAEFGGISWRIFQRLCDFALCSVHFFAGSSE